MLKPLRIAVPEIMEKRCIMLCLSQHLLKLLFMHNTCLVFCWFDYRGLLLSMKLSSPVYQLCWLVYRIWLSQLSCLGSLAGMSRKRSVADSNSTWGSQLTHLWLTIMPPSQSSPPLSWHGAGPSTCPLGDWPRLGMISGGVQRGHPPIRGVEPEGQAPPCSHPVWSHPKWVEKQQTDK